jgi:putative transposase
MDSQSLQVTANRAALAFAAFFKRASKGEVAGYPRFKSLKRFTGWGYKKNGNGFKLGVANKTDKKGKERVHHGTVDLANIGKIKMRGNGRFTGTPKTAEVVHKQGKWYLSVTYDVKVADVARETGTEIMAFDWGISTLMTIAKADGTTAHIDNPRWLKNALEAIKTLQRVISEEQIKAKVAIGLKPEDPIPIGTKLPVSKKMKKLFAQLAAVYGKIARQRKDFYHKLTAWLVETFGAIATEALTPKNMSKRPKQKPDPDNPGQFLPNGAAAKAGLNRGILDAAPSMLTGMTKSKAVEAAALFHIAPTIKVKPTQRCHKCGVLVKKTLAERTHSCSCGCVCDRDENAAKTLLRWMTEGDFWINGSEGRESGLGFMGFNYSV